MVRIKIADGWMIVSNQDSKGAHDCLHAAQGLWKGLLQSINMRGDLQSAIPCSSSDNPIRCRYRGYTRLRLRRFWLRIASAPVRLPSEIQPAMIFADGFPRFHAQAKSNCTSLLLLPSATVLRFRAGPESAVTQAAPRPPWNLAFCPITIEHHLPRGAVKYVLCGGWLRPR